MRANNSAMSLHIKKLILAHEKSHTMLLLKQFALYKKALSTSLICRACLGALLLARRGTAIADF